MLWILIIFAVVCLGITLYGLYNLIIYIVGQKVKAIVVDVETRESMEGKGHSIAYTYCFNINNVSRVVKGPENYLLFPPILSKEQRIGKRVYISYIAKTNKVAMQLRTIIWWTVFGILGTYAMLTQIIP